MSTITHNHDMVSWQNPKGESFEEGYLKIYNTANFLGLEFITWVNCGMWCRKEENVRDVNVRE